MLCPVRRLSSYKSIARFFLLASLALLILPLSTPAMARKDAGKNQKPKLDSKTAKFETQSLTKSIDKHARIIQKLKGFDSQTDNLQLIAFANVFIASEEEELTVMKMMLRNWYQINYVPRLDDDEDEGEVADDIDIISAMISYGNSEIAWAKQVEKKSGHAELKTLAKQTITSSRAQVAELKSYLRLLETDDESSAD